MKGSIGFWLFLGIIFLLLVGINPVDKALKSAALDPAQLGQEAAKGSQKDISLPVWLLIGFIILILLLKGR